MPAETVISVLAVTLLGTGAALWMLPVGTCRSAPIAASRSWRGSARPRHRSAGSTGSRCAPPAAGTTDQRRGIGPDPRGDEPARPPQCPAASAFRSRAMRSADTDGRLARRRHRGVAIPAPRGTSIQRHEGGPLAGRPADSRSGDRRGSSAARSNERRGWGGQPRRSLDPFAAEGTAGSLGSADWVDQTVRIPAPGSDEGIAVGRCSPLSGASQRRARAGLTRPAADAASRCRLATVDSGVTALRGRPAALARPIPRIPERIARQVART